MKTSIVENLLFSVVAILVIGAIAVNFTPDHILFPNREAPIRAYQAVAGMFDKTRMTSEYSTYPYKVIEKGSCPDLAIPAINALKDRKLTFAEYHNLKVRAEYLHKQSVKQYFQQSALKAAGIKVNERMIDCQGGDNLERNGVYNFP